MKLRIPAFVIAITLLTACRNDHRQAMIYGQWQAATVLEEGDSLAVDPTNIGFTFQENGRYTYQSTIGYREAGRFQMRSRMLYTTDTLAEKEITKTVEITRLTTDSLLLRMSDNGKERQMVLIRKED